MRSWGKLNFFNPSFILLVFLAYQTGQAQVYQLSKKTDYSIGIGVFTLLAIDYGLYERYQPLSLTEINGLGEDLVFKLDRNTIQKRSLLAEDWSDYMHYSAMLLPLTVLIPNKMDDNLKTISVMLVEAISLNLSTTFLTKYLARRPRPFIYNPQTVLADKQTRAATESFVSGHTSNAAMLSVFSATVFNDLFPESKWRTPIWAAALTIPAAVGILRVESGKHFPTDVLAGYGLGALIGYLVPTLHRRDSKIQVTSSAFGAIGITISLNHL